MGERKTDILRQIHQVRSGSQSQLIKLIHYVMLRQFLGDHTKDGRWPARTTRKKNKGQRVSCLKQDVEYNNNLPLSTWAGTDLATVREKMDSL